MRLQGVNEGVKRSGESIHPSHVIILQKIRCRVGTPRHHRHPSCQERHSSAIPPHPALPPESISKPDMASSRAAAAAVAPTAAFQRAPPRSQRRSSAKSTRASHQVVKSKGDSEHAAAGAAEETPVVTGVNRRTGIVSAAAAAATLAGKAPGLTVCS